MLIIGVLNQKGGSNKTTIAMNLAASLTWVGRVLLVDVDPQQSATFWAKRVGDKAAFDFTGSTDPDVLTKINNLDYEVVIVDTPGSLEGGTVLSAVVPRCDLVIIPTEPSALAFEPLQRTVSLVSAFDVPYRVLVSRVDPRSDDTDLADVHGLLDGLQIPYFATYIRAYKIHTRAPLEGKVVTDMGWSRAARHARADFENLSRQVISAARSVPVRKA